jgi:hypothetical protein
VGFSADPERHAPDCPGRSGAGKPSSFKGNPCQTTEEIRASAPVPTAGGKPVSWIDLLKEAKTVVGGKEFHRRFIAGTPLENDIAVWMADFALQQIQHINRLSGDKP